MPRKKGKVLTTRPPLAVDLQGLAEAFSTSKNEIVSMALLEFAEKHKEKIAA